MLLLVLSSFARAQSPEVPTFAIEGLVDAIRTSQGTLVMAFTLTLLVWGMRNLPVLQDWMTKLPKAAMPWVAIGLGVLGGVSSALIEGKPILEAAIHGIVVGLCGAGTWSAGTKHLLKKPEGKGPSQA